MIMFWPIIIALMVIIGYITYMEETFTKGERLVGFFTTLCLPLVGVFVEKVI